MAASANNKINHQPTTSANRYLSTDQPAHEADHCSAGAGSTGQSKQHAAAQCCYRFADLTGDATTINCPAAGVGACNLRGQAIKYFTQGSASSGWAFGYVHI